MRFQEAEEKLKQADGLCYADLPKILDINTKSYEEEL